MSNKYNQYYRQQKSNVNPAKNPEDEIKQDLDNASAEDEQQSNGVINPEDTELDNEPQQSPDDAGSTPEPPAEPIDGRVTDCLKLNVRKEPSLEAGILCEVPLNAKLAIIPETSNEEWYNVVTETGVSGFCMAKYVNVN